MEGEKLLALESRGCFDFFYQEVNLDESSPGYGLIRDRAPGHPGISSIASVGFGLTALVIGVERGYISHAQGYDRALATLHTLYHHAEQINGFFYHFLDMKTAKRVRSCEVSIIDTAIAVNGAITVGEYFGGAVHYLAQQLYHRVDWFWYRDPARNQFYMAYTPEKGFSGWWDCAAEQLMLYILGAGSPTHPVPGNMMADFERHVVDAPKERRFIHSWFGSLFVHQFSHAWIDFRNQRDAFGVDWWDNSVRATQSNHRYCTQMGKHFTTLKKAWGLTPCDGPFGYNGRYGAPPSDRNNNEHIVDGTVPPAGAAGSIVFSPVEVMDTLNDYYKEHPKLWGCYGFQDAMNLDMTPAWYASDVIGIDKGITLLMIENYRTGLIWEIFMQNTCVLDGLARCGFHYYPDVSDARIG